MRIGSLFSGYGGLEMGVSSVLGGTTAWVSDIDPGACKILAHRYPGVPNMGDISKVDWSAVEPVDVITGGFPCQDVSHAGKRAGLKPDTRSGLWSQMAYAIDTLRPRLVVAENVRGLLSAEAHGDVEQCPWCVGGAADGEPPLRALGAVLGDLADLGYDARWVGLRAADVGAPHGRFRVFVVASPADAGSEAFGLGAGLRESQSAGEWRRRLDHDRAQASTPDAGSERHGRGEDAGAVGRVDGPDAGEARERERTRGVAGDRGAEVAADTEGDRRDARRPESAGLVGGPDAAERGHAAGDTTGLIDEDESGCDAAAGQHVEPVARAVRRDRPGDPAEGVHDLGRPAPVVAWGDYAPAVARWAAVLGRTAPAPTELGKNGARLSPRFVEWMMGLPEGHVTDVPGLTRNEQLKALGNGVVPQQAAAAVRIALGAPRERVA